MSAAEQARLARAVVVTFVFVNIGRARNASIAAKAWDLVGDRFAAIGAWFALLVEVQEGDSYDERAMVKRAFRRARRFFMRKARVTLVVARDRKVLRHELTAAGKPVEHWSPPRKVADATAAADHAWQPNVCGIVTHAAAGANNGDRPDWAHPLLLASWHLTLAVTRRRIRAALRRGEHVVIAADMNDRGFKVTRWHPDAVELFSDAPDYSAAVPAPGWRVADKRHHSKATGVESLHRLHETTVRFEPNDRHHQKEAA